MLVDRKTWIYVKQALDFFSDVDNVPFCNDYLHTKTFFFIINCLYYIGNNTQAI